MMTELEKKILLDIEKTGFLTELSISKLFIDKGWRISASETYIDKDSNKSREIDIIASLGEFSQELQFTFVFKLVAEIKKDSKRPWVIFSTKKDSLTEQDNRWAKFMTYGENTTTKEGSVFWYNNPFDKFPVNSSNRIGRTFHEAFKKPNEKSKIFEALISCCKAAYYFKETYGDTSYEKDFIIKEFTHLTISLPIVILDGNLYEVFIDKFGETQLYKRDWMPIKINYSSPNYIKNDFGFSETFLPEIVTREGLSDYLFELTKWFEYHAPLFKKTMKLWRDGKGVI